MGSKNGYSGLYRIGKGRSNNPRCCWHRSRPLSRGRSCRFHCRYGRNPDCPSLSRGRVVLLQSDTYWRGKCMDRPWDFAGSSTGYSAIAGRHAHVSRAHGCSDGRTSDTHWCGIASSAVSGRRGQIQSRTNRTPTRIHNPENWNRSRNQRLWEASKHSSVTARQWYRREKVKQVVEQQHSREQIIRVYTCWSPNGYKISILCVEVNVA